MRRTKYNGHLEISPSNHDVRACAPVLVLIVGPAGRVTVYGYAIMTYDIVNGQHVVRAVIRSSDCELHTIFIHASYSPKHMFASSFFLFVLLRMNNIF